MMEPPVGELVLATREGSLGIITLNRPERHNALNNQMSAELGAASKWAYGDSSIHAVLLRAEGPSFSSGRDTAQLGQREGGESDLNFVRRAQDSRVAMLSAPKPILAAVQGYVLGGAFETALAADIRIAADDARFAFPEIEFGLLPDTGGTALLTSLIGPSKTKWMVLSGERIDAATALEWGIVDFVVPRAELDETARSMARRLAEAPPQAAAMGKQLIDQAWQGTILNGLHAELLAQTALFAGEEHATTKAARIEELKAARARRSQGAEG